MSLFDELKQRRVFRTVSTYAIGCFVILQLLDVVGEPLGISADDIRYVILVMAVGFPVVIYLSWAFDLIPGKSRYKPNSKRTSNTAVVLAGVAIVTFAISAWWVLSPEIQSPPKFEPSDPLAKKMAEVSALETVPLIFHNVEFSDTGLSGETRENERNVVDDIKKRVARIEGLQLLDPEDIDSYPTPVYHLYATRRQIGARARFELRFADEHGDILWQDVFEEPADRSFTLHRDIALAVGDTLGRSNTVQMKDRLGTHSTENPLALQLYQRARGVGLGAVVDTNNTAIELLHEALSFDPDFADAHAQLARAYRFNYATGDVSALVLARDHATRALEIDPESADAHQEMGGVYAVQGQLRLAAASLRQALLLNSSIEHAAQDLSYFLALTGELEDSLEFALQSANLRPRDGNTLFHLTVPLALLDPERTKRLVSAALVAVPLTETLRLQGISMWIGYVDGQAEEVRARIRSLKAIGTRFDIPEASTTAAWGLWALGDNGGAVEILEALEAAGRSGKTFLPTNDRSLALRAHLFDEDARILHLTTAISESEQLIARGNESPSRRVELASMRVAIGDVTGALEAIDEAHDLGFRAALALETHPAFVDIKDLPEFRARTSRMRRDVQRMYDNANRYGLMSEVDRIIEGLEQGREDQENQSASESSSTL